MFDHHTQDSGNVSYGVETDAGRFFVKTAGSLRSDPASAFRRFRRLPVPVILGALDSIVDLHRYLAASGWIAVDFYDGSLLYNFSTGVLLLIDLDSYHAGPFVNRMGRMFGSTRFMAPEEFELGAPIDQRTNVFMLGRTVRELLSDHPAGMLSDDLRDVSHRACLPDPSDRYPTVADFPAAWTAARRGHRASGRRVGASGIDAAG